jgi:hypothetical protein
MKSCIAKNKLTTFALISLVLLSQSSDLFAERGRVDPKVVKRFKQATKEIERIPYNPRPVAADTADVTGISEDDSRTSFLSTFTRVEFLAPANGRTSASSDPANAPDITLVGYLQVQKDTGGNPLPDRPGIILTHGGYGQGSIARQGQFLIHIANVLFDVGYHVLAIDRRDGLLSRCGYSAGDPPQPDDGKSQPRRVDGPPSEFCSELDSAFRDTTFDPDTLVSGFGSFGAGDILAAAQLLRDETGTDTIGALSGSRGGLTLIRAATIQDNPDNDFAAGLLNAILVFSPVADDNTSQLASSNTRFSCVRPRAAEFYSTINGSGLRDFSDPEGAMEDFFRFLNGVEAIQTVKIPILIIQTLTDDQTFINGALAYKAITDKMRHGHTLIMTRVGHYHEMWRSDPFWGDKVVLTYFKRLLANDNAEIGEDPGFGSLGPNSDNPLIVKLRLQKTDADKLLSQESVVPFLLEACFGP